MKPSKITIIGAGNVGASLGQRLIETAVELHCGQAGLVRDGCDLPVRVRCRAALGIQCHLLLGVPDGRVAVIGEHRDWLAQQSLQIVSQRLVSAPRRQAAETVTHLVDHRRRGRGFGLMRAQTGEDLRAWGTV